MKDFRLVVTPVRPPERSDVEDLLKKGQLAKALRAARAAGIVVTDDEIDATARKMFLSGRVGELLAMIGNVNVKLPHDTGALLLRAFEVGDHHTFLKQAHRLGMCSGLEGEINKAIGAIEVRAPREANDWRRKFSTVLLDAQMRRPKAVR